MTLFSTYPSLCLNLDFSQTLQSYHEEEDQLNDQSSLLKIVLHIIMSQSTTKNLNNVSLGTILVTKK